MGPDAVRTVRALCAPESAGGSADRQSVLEGTGASAGASLQDPQAGCARSGIDQAGFHHFINLNISSSESGKKLISGRTGMRKSREGIGRLGAVLFLCLALNISAVPVFAEPGSGAVKTESKGSGTEKTESKGSGTGSGAEKPESKESGSESGAEKPEAKASGTGSGAEIKLPVGVEEYLERFPDTDMVYIHFDNDEPGRTAGECLRAALQDRQIASVLQYPPMGCKDVNDYLVAVREYDAKREAGKQAEAGL